MVELKEQQASLASRHIIERPRLTRLLDETTARVILLVAPAGYGKTTLARQWLAKRPHAWLEGGNASADVASLVKQVGHALATLGFPLDQRAQELLRSVHKRSVLETLATLQAEMIDPWPSDAWLAIDEYEAVASSEPSDAYVDVLLRDSKINLLLTSRLIPSWATPRGRVYGDYLLVDRDQLALGDTEAEEVLRGRDAADVPTIVSAAAGWPAVVGLAALATAPELGDPLPQALYDYFADELFRRASPSLQRALPQLALLPAVRPALVAAAFGEDDGIDLVEEAADLGFVTKVGDEFSFQPLLRSFLSRKRSAEQGSEIADRMIASLLEAENWDGAFEVISAVSRPNALIALLENAHESLLKAGRTSTLTEWLDFATRTDVHAPILDLIRSELAIREGAVAYAEQLALRVAEETEDHSLATRALAIAGRAAHLDNRGAESLVHFRAASELAECDNERHHAAWGALLAAQELDSDDELGLVLDAFLQHGVDSADDSVRAATARLAVALSRDGLSGVIEPTLAALRAFRRAADPLALTGLLNSLSRSLALVARYDEARELADEELDVAVGANLQFVIPYGHVAQAAALIGLARYREAKDSLALAMRHAEDIGDAHNVFDALTLRAKSAIAQGDPRRAAALTGSRVDTAGVTSGMRAEYKATHGLALACAGDAGAQAALSEAEALSSIPEAAALVSCGRAVVALGTDAGIEGAARELERPFELLILDPLVISTRAFPSLMKAAKATGRHLPQRLLDAMAAPVARSKREQLLASLTPREREVLELMTRGYTNREIASTLVIAEVTAKVHVRRVIKKLGVRSRTEAAIAAIQREPATPT